MLSRERSLFVVLLRFSSWCVFMMYRISSFFFLNDTATTEIYTLSLHDALPISGDANVQPGDGDGIAGGSQRCLDRSEEHTSELQSRLHLVCRLLLEKKKLKSTMLKFTELSIVSIDIVSRIALRSDINQKAAMKN